MATKIKEFEMIVHYDADIMNEHINNMLEKGYELHGDLKVVMEIEENDTILAFVQVMVKYETD